MSSEENTKKYPIKNGYYWDEKNNESVHRIIGKKKYGKDIPKGWVIHHIDGDKLNNDENNLVLLSIDEHKAIQRRIWDLTNLNLLYFFLVGVALTSLLISKFYTIPLSDIYFLFAIFLLFLSLFFKVISRTKTGRKLLVKILFNYLKILRTKK